MKYFVSYLVALLFVACSSQEHKFASEDEVFKVAEKKYDSLTEAIKDSLSTGLSNVNDFNNVYTNTERSQLDSIIKEFKARTGLRLAVITFDSTMASIDSVEEVTRIIGARHRINTTVGISVPYKTMHIWNDSLVNNTMLPSEVAKEIIDTYFIPSFREDAYYNGTLNGLIQIKKTIEGKHKSPIQ